MDLIIVTPYISYYIDRSIVIDRSRLQDLQYRYWRTKKNKAIKLFRDTFVYTMNHNMMIHTQIVPYKCKLQRP